MENIIGGNMKKLCILDYKKLFKRLSIEEINKYAMFDIIEINIYDFTDFKKYNPCFYNFIDNIELIKIASKSRANNLKVVWNFNDIKKVEDNFEDILYYAKRIEIDYITFKKTELKNNKELINKSYYLSKVYNFLRNIPKTLLDSGLVLSIVKK